MEKGGKNDGTAKIERIIRYAGFLIPLVLIAYGCLIWAGVVKTEHFFSEQALLVISVSWIALGIYQLAKPAVRKRTHILRIGLNHILGVSYILLVSGFSMPFIGTWVILFLAAFAYAGRDGLNLSIFALFGTVLADILINIDHSSYITSDILYFVGVLVVGYITGIITAAQEVDRDELSRSHAEELLQRDRITTIVNNLADAILSTDEHGAIQMYNAATLNLLDTNLELKGQSIDSVISLFDEDKHTLKLIHSFKEARSVVSREDLSATISGETIHLSLIYSPIRSTDSNTRSAHDGYVVILRDITKQKSLEEERDEFISVVSHELRTPITIAEGSLSNLQIMMDRPDIPRTTQVENVKMAHDQVLFLARMVNDLSTLSRAERGVADEVEDIDVTSLINDLYAEYAPQAAAKGLKFNLELDPVLGSVSASRLYLKELLQNFVTNAIKYTKEGHVTVIVSRKDNKLNFAVRDSGIGISKSDQAHIYEKFWRSEDYRTRETGGTGLGLYVAMKLAKKLSTQIDMTSRLNHGSTFSFALHSSSK